MLEARRVSLWRSRYELVADGRPLATWDGRVWRNGGSFDLAGRHYEVTSNVFGTRFELTDQVGMPVATAQRVGRRRWTVEAGGRSVVDAGPGDFIHVPAHVVHRESNPTGQRATAVIARAGAGVPTVNVDAPDPVGPGA